MNLTNGEIVMLWTEKYRPKMLHHLIGQESFKLDAEVSLNTSDAGLNKLS